MENKILIIDGNHKVLASLTSALELKGFTIRSLENSHQIHSHMENFMPDLVIMEIEHPSMDGRVLCDEIKAKPGFARTPVVLLTSMEYKNIGLIDCQAEAILGKPYNIDNLLLTVQNLIL